MEELELRDLIRILRKRAGLIISITLVAVLVSAVLSFFVIKPQYEATTTLLVNKKQTAGVPGVEYNEIMANQALVKTYNEIIKSRSVAETVIQKLNLPMTPEEFAKMIQVNSVNQSQVFSVSVTYPDPHMAVVIANTIADTFKQKVVSLMQVENVQVVDKAVDEADPRPVSPKKTLNIAIAFFLGLMVSTGLAFLLEYMDNTIKTEEDVERVLGLPVLGSIAMMDEGKRKRKRKRSVEARASQSAEVAVKEGIHHGA